MNHLIETTETQTPLHYVRIAWQSALAASLCLGLPAGLLFWLIMFQRLRPSHVVERLMAILSNGGGFEGTFIIIGVLAGAFGWGIILSKISGYRLWLWLAMASVLGVYLGRQLFGGVYRWLNIDFSSLPIHMTLAIHLSGLVLSITFCTGLAHGLLLRNWRSILTLAFSTSLVSVLAVLLTIIILDQLGLRVGTGNAAMPKVTAICTMAAAITGGMTLGVLFSRYLEKGNLEISSSIQVVSGSKNPSSS